MEKTTLSTLRVRRLEGRPDAKQLPALLDACGAEWHEIDKVNWPAKFPYRPVVRFRIAHCGDALVLQYRCSEQCVRAVADDNGAIWQDSCVEFFVSFDNHIYYNVEFNCAGRMLIGGGHERKGRQRATPEILALVERNAAFDGHFENTPAPDEWELSVVIPMKAFFLNDIKDVSGSEARANFYKCGDLTEVPHYLSWSPVDTEAPAFHTPTCFGHLIFD